MNRKTIYVLTSIVWIMSSVWGCQQFQKREHNWIVFAGWFVTMTIFWICVASGMDRWRKNRAKYDMMPDDISHSDNKVKRKVHPRAKDCFFASLVPVVLIASGLPWMVLFIMPGWLFVHGSYYTGMAILVGLLLIMNIRNLWIHWGTQRWRYLSIAASLSCVLILAYCVLACIADWSLHPT